MYFKVPEEGSIVDNMVIWFLYYGNLNQIP